MAPSESFIGHTPQPGTHSMTTSTSDFAPPTRLRQAPIAAAAAFVIGLGAILGAWGFQIIGGYIPCALCYEERIPYYVGLPIIALALGLAAGGRETAFRWLMAAAGIVFLVGVGLGVRHAGVEWGFFPAPADCGGGVGATTNAADLLGAMSRAKIVPCSEAAGRFLGISFAGWNAVACLMVTALAFLAVAWSRRPAGTSIR